MGIALRLTRLFALALIVAACGGGGGGGGPTAPPPPAVENIAGVWTGVWVAPCTVRMELAQAGANVTGNITTCRVTFPLLGTVSVSDRFTWHADESGCGSFSGSMTIFDSDLMAGNATLDTRGCPGDLITGVMSVGKEGAAASRVPAQLPGSLPQDLAEALRHPAD